MSAILYGPILGKIRRDKMIKADVIARHVGISAATYSRIETGRRSASYERVTAICDELGISLPQLNELIIQVRPINHVAKE
ncbi:MAG: helix-turn-helix domain-containing protein [Veillonellaceae bacterium]|nr:helix-turn-helix domain-containing protein [Veillonellaceae bacterium]